MLARVTERERERVQFSSLMSKLAGMELEARISHPSAPSFPQTTEKWKGKWEGAGRYFCPCWLEKKPGRRFLLILTGEGDRQRLLSFLTKEGDK